MRKEKEKVNNNVYDKLINLIDSRMRINNNKAEKLTVGLKRNTIAYMAIRELFSSRNYSLRILKEIIIIGAKTLLKADYIEVSWVFSETHPSIKYHHINESGTVLNTILLKHISLPKIDSKLFNELILEISNKQEIKLAA
jgi:hypothetical protein